MKSIIIFVLLFCSCRSEKEKPSALEFYHPYVFTRVASILDGYIRQEQKIEGNNSIKVVLLDRYWRSSDTLLFLISAIKSKWYKGCPENYFFIDSCLILINTHKYDTYAPKLDYLNMLNKAIGNKIDTIGHIHDPLVWILCITSDTVYKISGIDNSICTTSAGLGG